MLTLTAVVRDAMVAHCIAALPLEGCGLLVGDPDTSLVADAVGMCNAADSALVYALDPKEHLAVDRAATARGLEVIGGFHSHTHTDAWPSPTDVAAAVDPTWHWIVVSLRRADPVVRSFRIVGERIDEEPVQITEE